MKIKHIYTPSTKIRVQFLKGNYEEIGSIYTEIDDIKKLKLPDDVNMIFLDYPDDNHSKSFLIGDIVYQNEDNKQATNEGPKSWLKLFNGPTINFSNRTNIISPQELNLTQPKQLCHIAYTIDYPHTEGYIRKFNLQNHDITKVKITDNWQTANFIELYDLTPDYEKINVELFAIGTSLSLEEVAKLNLRAFEYMQKFNIKQAFMDSKQKVFPITEKNVKILPPNAFNNEGFFEPDRLSYLELE